MVGENGKQGIAAAGVRDAGDGFRALCVELVRFGPRPVVHAHLMAGLQEARRHASTHMPQSDESYLHDNTPLLLCGCLREAQPAPIRPSPTPIANTMPPSFVTASWVASLPAPSCRSSSAAASYSRSASGSDVSAQAEPREDKTRPKKNRPKDVKLSIYSGRLSSMEKGLA